MCVYAYSRKYVGVWEAVLLFPLRGFYNVGALYELVRGAIAKLYSQRRKYNIENSLHFLRVQIAEKVVMEIYHNFSVIGIKRIFPKHNIS